VGWALQEAAKLRGRALAWVPAGLVALLVLALVPGAIARVRKEHKDLYHERLRTTQIDRLQSTINSLGGYKAVLRVWTSGDQRRVREHRRLDDQAGRRTDRPPSPSSSSGRSIRSFSSRR